MHICFSLMVAVPIMHLARYPWVRILALGLSATVFFVIVATGNHFWFDAVAGAAVACLAAVSARRSPASGRTHWAWREATSSSEASPA